MKFYLISNVPLRNHLGSGFVINNIIKGLINNGHSVNAIEPDDFQLFRLKIGARYILILSILIEALNVYFKRKCDLLIFYGAESALAVSVLKLLPKRFIIANNSNGLETNYYENMQDYYKRQGISASQKWFNINLNPIFDYAFKNSDILVLNNKYDYEYSLERGYQKPGNLLYTDLGLDSAYLNLKIKPVSQRQKILVFCGSWIARKGIELIKADVTRFLIEYPEYKLLLIGTGDNFDLNEEFNSEVHTQIEVRGFIKDKDEIKELLSNSRVFLFPSIYESFGLSLAEAMACGCCAIANNTGFASSLNHTETAYILPNLSTPSLYDALNLLINKPDLMDSIGYGAYKRVQDLKWEGVVEQIDQFYRKHI